MTMARKTTKIAVFCSWLGRTSVDSCCTSPMVRPPKNAPEKPYVYGWLSAGVPGVLAGLDLALHRYGTLSFAQALEPAQLIQSL